MSLFKFLKAIFRSKLSARYANNQQLIRIKAYELTQLAINSKEKGISESLYTDHEIIVSLTTFGKRLYDVHMSIESIMQGSVKPNRIVLWLEESLKGKKLPVALQNQQRRGLEIMYCEDLRSYKKLLPTMIKYPQSAIITIDDDVFYYYDVVEKLINAHIDEPNCIFANRLHKIKLGKDGRPLSYLKWDWHSYSEDNLSLNFLTGIGGVLYPPHSLDDSVFDKNTFMNICKYADDIWFYAMALKKGTLIKKVFTHSEIGDDFLVNEGVQDIGLRVMNTDSNDCRNDIQFKAVFEKYNLYEKLK